MCGIYYYQLWLLWAIAYDQFRFECHLQSHLSTAYPHDSWKRSSMFRDRCILVIHKRYVNIVYWHTLVDKEQPSCLTCPIPKASGWLLQETECELPWEHFGVRWRDKSQLIIERAWSIPARQLLLIHLCSAFYLYTAFLLQIAAKTAFRQNYQKNNCMQRRWRSRL